MTSQDVLYLLGTLAGSFVASFVLVLVAPRLFGAKDAGGLR